MLIKTLFIAIFATLSFSATAQSNRVISEDYMTVKPVNVDSQSTIYAYNSKSSCILLGNVVKTPTIQTSIFQKVLTAIAGPQYEYSVQFKTKSCSDSSFQSVNITGKIHPVERILKEGTVIKVLEPTTLLAII